MSALLIRDVPISLMYHYHLRSWTSVSALNEHLTQQPNTVTSLDLDLPRGTYFPSHITSLIHLFTTLSTDLDSLTLNIAMPRGIRLDVTLFPSFTSLTVLETTLPHHQLLPLLDNVNAAPSLSSLTIGRCHARGDCALHALTRRADRVACDFVSGPGGCVSLIPSRLPFQHASLKWESLRRLQQAYHTLSTTPSLSLTSIRVPFTQRHPRFLAGFAPFLGNLYRLVLVEHKLSKSREDDHYPWQNLGPWRYELAEMPYLRYLEVDLASECPCEVSLGKYAKQWMFERGVKRNVVEFVDFYWKGTRTLGFKWARGSDDLTRVVKY